VTGPISADGGTAYVTTTTPGQRAVFNFSASPSQRVSLQIGGIPSCNGACADVYLKSSSGDVLGSAYVQDTGAWIDTKELTAGTHTVEVDPRGSWTISNLALTVYTVPPDPVVPMLIGSTASAATSTPGQNATFRFTALAGSTVKVTANGSPCTGACADISVRPWGSGTVIAGPQYVSSTGATLSSVALNQTGEYYVKFDPRGSRTMMATVTVSQTGGPSIQDLLERHLPIWKYDSGERFHILSPGALTDFYTGDSFASSNALKDANGAFALANQTFGTYPNGVLRLSYLQSMYPTDTSRRAGTAAETSDNVSARGNNDDGFYEGDAQEMEGRSNYPYKVYARPAFGSDGKLWLQYWVFYYFNPDPASPLGDVHEGDWEMIQVGLNADRTPEDAVYAQHDSGQKCAWPSVERAGDSPVVYVGEHSHASYFGPDRIPAAYLYDHADGGGGGLFAGEVRQIGSNDPPWMAWNGHWGDSGKSPQGPQYQPPENRWRDPSAWPANPTPCL
jgi:hypothetical protein